MNKNQNIRFNMDKESDIMAWESLHSKDVGERFKSQNRFVIEAINYYYERVMRIQEDPYLETREKEDAFADRIVGKVERKVLSNLPTLLGLYVKKDFAMKFSQKKNTKQTGVGIVDTGYDSSDNDTFITTSRYGNIPIE